jgi:hypothetical protein
MKEISEDKDLMEYLPLKIGRSRMWTTTLLYLKRWQDEELVKPLKIQFLGEPAEDEGGPRREFFVLTGRDALASNL